MLRAGAFNLLSFNKLKIPCSLNLRSNLKKIHINLISHILNFFSGNFVTLLALLKCPKLKNHATTAFIVSLCVSDFLFCAVSLPLQAIRFAMKEWTLGSNLCQIFPVVLYGNVAVSLLSMVCITMNRFVDFVTGPSLKVAGEG